MKKKNLKSLKLNKKSISQFEIIKGGAPAYTCEAPCEDGTFCCNTIKRTIGIRCHPGPYGDPVH